MKNEVKTLTVLDQLEEYRKHLTSETSKLIDAIFQFHSDFQEFLDNSYGETIDNVAVTKLYHTSAYGAYLRKALSYLNALDEITSESLMVDNRINNNKPF